MFDLIQLIRKEDVGRVGGGMSFTDHLQRALPGSRIYRLCPRDNGVETFCKTERQAMSVEDYLARDDRQPMIITVTLRYPEILQRLVEHEPWIVFHDQRGITDLGEDFCQEYDKMIVIRERMRLYCPKATFLPHPFIMPFCQNTGKKRMIAHSRICFNKRTHLIEEANRRAKNKCDIFGYATRAYVHWKLGGDFYQRGFVSLDDLGLQDYVYDIDLTHLPNDGEGTQYTWMEGMAHGCIPVVHSDWGQCPFKALYVDGVDDIVSLLDDDVEDFSEMQEFNKEYLLTHHSAKVIQGILCS